MKQWINIPPNLVIYSVECLIHIKIMEIILLIITTEQYWSINNNNNNNFYLYPQAFQAHWNQCKSVQSAPKSIFTKKKTKKTKNKKTTNHAVCWPMVSCWPAEPRLLRDRVMMTAAVAVAVSKTSAPDKKGWQQPVKQFFFFLP